MRLLSRPLAIFYDTNRARVLDVLLSTTNSMSGRQIARMAGISPTTAGAALTTLESTGMVQSKPVGRSYQWSLSIGNVLIDQLRELSQLRDDQAGEIIAKAVEEEPVSIALFGSTARGDSGADSDVDLLLVAKDFEQETRLRRHAYEIVCALQPLIGREINVVVMELSQIQRQRDSSFWKEIIRDGTWLRGRSVQELVS
jgi:predicted nucleotidyltransferase